jgi:hypothetical protein
MAANDGKLAMVMGDGARCGGGGGVNGSTRRDAEEQQHLAGANVEAEVESPMA